MLRVASPAEAAQVIGGGWRVLDVGSGDRPFGPATVLVDRTPRRCTAVDGLRAENPSGTIIRRGKPLIVADLEQLSFADQSFDFVYASHVIEHVEDPLGAAGELARVAPRGYIECPRAWFEFVDASPFHRWLIDHIEGELQFRPKSETESQFMNARRLFDLSPELFSQLYDQVFTDADPGGTSVEKSLCHVCVYWEGSIPCRVLPASVYREGAG